MDWLAWVGVAAALAATGIALLATRAERTRAAVGWLVLAAALLRVPPAAHFSLSAWDERYHAVVARNEMRHPFVPMLVAAPLEEPAPDDWRHAHVWLHKPPLTTWLMALAMAAFGANEVALRVPSILAASLAVALVFALARRFVSERAALFAAGLAAWQARSLLLVAGVRATDHVDVMLSAAVALGAVAAVRAAEAADGPPRRFARRTALVGGATALAWYAKETPALVVPALFLFLLLAREASWRARLLAPAGALAVAAALVAPWLGYTAQAFPAVAAVARARGGRYFWNVVDKQGGPWWFHFANLPLDFGWLAPAALLGFAFVALRRRRELLPLVAWVALVYGTFSLAATKMQSYPLVAAPALFVALGWLAWDAVPRAAARAALCAVLCGNAAWTALAVEAPLTAKARDPLWAAELRRLGAEVERMPEGRRVVFGTPAPTECLFYARATCVAAPADAATVARASAQGFFVATYGEGAIPGALHISIDPRAVPARNLVQALRSAGAHEALVFNAAHAADLREYLVRQMRHTYVSESLPRPSKRLTRKLAEGATLAVLLPPGAEPPAELAAEFPEALYLEDATYARELSSGR
ncbi:MAG TPA: glycosyltransferase family 39 protein [Myxococcota bacterium]|nr:glycosyltransferase family 39 protein [Myxococcota bacterium]